MAAWSDHEHNPPADPERAGVIRAQLARLERVATFNPAGAAPAIGRLRAELAELEQTTPAPINLAG